MRLELIVRFLVLASLVTFIAGCATPYGDGTRAAEANNYMLAEKLFNDAIREGDRVGEAWNNLGVIYARTNRPELAIAAYTMGARYGSAVAQANLVRNNKPVPPADLANTIARPSSTSGLADALDAYGKARYPATAPTVTCVSRRTLSGRVETECQ